MRLDARNGDTNWYVLHVPSSRPIPFVVWVDDELAQYGQHDVHHMPLGALPPIRTVQVTKILICPGPRVVLVDPLDNDQMRGADRDVIAPTKVGENA